MGKLEYLGKDPISLTQWKPYDINLDEGFTAIKVQENKTTTTTTTKKERSFCCVTDHYRQLSFSSLSV